MGAGGGEECGGRSHEDGIDGRHDVCVDLASFLTKMLDDDFGERESGLK